MFFNKVDQAELTTGLSYAHLFGGRHVGKRSATICFESFVCVTPFTGLGQALGLKREFFGSADSNAVLLNIKVTTVT